MDHLRLFICVFFAIQSNFIVFGNMRATYYVNIGESLSIRIESPPNGLIDDCFVRPPFEAAFIDIISRNEKSKFEYTGGRNNSCSFKIPQITEDSIGTWHVASRYLSTQNDNLTAYFQHIQSFDIDGMSMRSFESEIGESLRITVPSQNKPIVECLIRRPVDQDFFSYSNTSPGGGDFKYAGARYRSCSFNITNFTDNHIGRWQVYTSYRPYPDDSKPEVKNFFFFIINGIEKRTLEAPVGKGLIVNTFSRNNTQARCYIIGPRDIMFSFLNDEKWNSTIEFFGEKDNSCSFKFINVTDDIIGNWILTSIYISNYDERSYRKDIIITVKEKMKMEFSGKIGEFVETDISHPKGKTIDYKILYTLNENQGVDTWLDVTDDKKKNIE